MSYSLPFRRPLICEIEQGTWLPRAGQSVASQAAVRLPRVVWLQGQVGGGGGRPGGATNREFSAMARDIEEAASERDGAVTHFLRDERRRHLRGIFFSRG